MSLYRNALKLEFDNARCRGLNLLQILGLWHTKRITGKIQHADWPRDKRNFLQLRVLQDFLNDAKNYDAHVNTTGHIAMRTERGRLLITYDAKM